MVRFISLDRIFYDVLVSHKIDIRTEKLKLMNRNTLYYKVVQNEFAYIVQV